MAEKTICESFDRLQLNGSETSILDLPDEVLAMIFQRLTHGDVMHGIALVCQRFLKISRWPSMVKSAKIVGELLKMSRYVHVYPQ